MIISDIRNGKIVDNIIGISATEVRQLITELEMAEKRLIDFDDIMNAHDIMNGRIK